MSAATSCLSGHPRLFYAADLQYDIDDDWLGAGAFGEVFRCRLPPSGEVVAVKVLNSPRRLKERLIKDFHKEVCILHQLAACPNVIRLLGLCVEAGHYSIIMEFVENGNLEDLLLESITDHPVIEQWECRIRMGLDIATGMDFLHQRQPPIIHRDLKSANVLVDGKYCCKISDFGLSTARNISMKSTTALSQQKPAGTLAFVAPEVFKGNVGDHKSDVYAYSIVLWQLKEMKAPYDTERRPDIIQANVITGIRPDLSNNDCPEGFKDLITRCWDSNPDVRLSFGELIRMLDRILSSVGSGPSEHIGSHQTENEEMRHVELPESSFEMDEHPSERSKFETENEETRHVELPESSIEMDEHPSERIKFETENKKTELPESSIEMDEHPSERSKFIPVRSKNGVEMLNGQGIKPIHVADAGQYLCKVSNATGDDVSNLVHLQVDGLSTPVLDLVVGERHIGRDVIMKVTTDTPNVIWFKDDNVIEGLIGQKRCQINQVKAQDFGCYSCKSISRSCISLHGIEVSVVPPLEPAKKVGSCRGKVALLIGNQKYLSYELTKLHQPHNDVQALAGQLTSFGFHCVTLVDASKKEMEQALEFFEYLLVIGVHALFYFAGHGFEENGENYLVPVDVHEGFSLLECIKAQYILRIMQDRDTAFNFLILDTCRKGKDDASSSQQSCPQPLHNRANTIISYACNPQYDAYESKSIASDNGIFMAQFLKHIGEVKQVEDLLMTVNAAVFRARPEAVAEKKWQKPTFISSLAHRVSLHDCIVHNDEQYPSDNQFIESMRLWKLAHTIPSPINIDSGFTHDGVGVNLTFQSEFSNVLLIQVNVAHPAAVTDVRVSLSASGAKQTNYHVMDLQNHGISTMSSERSLGSNRSSSSRVGTSSSSSTSSSNSQIACSPFRFKIERLQRVRGDVTIVLNLLYTWREMGVSTPAGFQTSIRIEPPLIARIYQHAKD